MREIKFRAFWRDTLKPIPDFNDEYLIDACNDEVFIVNQYTGLKDCDGNDYYFDDIIKTKKGVGVLVWLEDRLGIGSGTINNYHTVDEISKHELSKSKKIGNIYETV